VLPRDAGIAAGRLAVDGKGIIREADWTAGGASPAAPGERLVDLVHPADRLGLTALVLGAITTAEPARRLLHVRIGAQYLPALVSVDDRCDELGTLQVRLVALTSGGFDLDALAQLAFWDPLTSLANRVLFTEYLRTELQRSVRSGRPTAVLVADVNGLKRVNDRLGHRAGDALLAEVGRRLVAGCRPSDVPARLSGDEFAVLCPEVDDDDTARDLAARLGGRLSGPLQVSGGTVDVEVALGWAVSTDVDVDDAGGDLLHRADLCMYGAKRFMSARQSTAGS
jgi:diguanylate cyclase (GGDEF)-like protein